MKQLMLYHGSPVIVERPSLEKGRANNDFGRGFYCTEHEDLAGEWACTSERGGFVNRYELNLDGLSVLRLDTLDCPMLRWLALLLEHRIVRLSSPGMRRGRDWLLERFSVDLTPVDIVVGYRADDSYFSFARAFLGNAITFAQLVRAMRLGELGEQYVLRSELAIASLRFIGAAPADRSVCYPKRRARDEAAIAAYNRICEQEDRGGILLRDLVEGRVAIDDERLR